VVVRQQRAMAKKTINGSYVLAGAAISLLLGGIGLWVAYPSLTYKGVPVKILVQFIEDPLARKFYFSGQKTALHNRLKEMDVEEQIKDFYRPQIQNEQQLDLYIHQLLYDNTGYIGAAYIVNGQGQLALSPTLSPEFWRWFELAKQLQLVTDQELEGGQVYVTTPQGDRVPYTTIAALYPIADLEKWVAATKPAP
jgi:hypothetical protein